MAQLPSFDFNLTVNAYDAWHDKIEWQFMPYHLRHGCKPDVFLESLSVPPKKQRNRLGADWGGKHGWLFVSSASIKKGYYRDIRQQRVKCHGEFLPCPLLSGKVRLRTASAQHKGKRLMEFTIESNPSRLAHYHPLGSDRERRFWKHFGLLTGIPRADSFGREFSLDGNDNWVPLTSAFDEIRSSPIKAAEEHFRLIQEALESEVKRASATGCTLRNPEARFNLRKLETYWEFAHPEAIRLAHSLMGVIRQFSKGDSSSSIYPAPTRALYTTHKKLNCASIMTHRLKGEQIVVYAKTNKRIRFEVRQDFTKNSDCIGGTHTMKSRKEMFAQIRKAREHCACRINELFAFLRKMNTFDPNAVSTTTLLADLALAIPDRRKLATVLALLRQNQELVNVPGLQKEITALKKAGIIELYGPKRAKIYHVTDRYRPALNRLKRIDRSTFLNARDR